MLFFAGLMAACDDDDDGGDNGSGNGDRTAPAAALPDDWPDDFPIYGGATLLNASQEDGQDAIVATWETADSLDQVRDFYAGEFADGPWQEVAAEDFGDSHNWIVEKNGEPGDLTISEDEGGGTTIIAFVGELLADITPESRNDDSAPQQPEQQPAAAAEEPVNEPRVAASGPVVSGFPDGMPVVPPDARVVAATTAEETGIRTARVEYEAVAPVDEAARTLTAGLAAYGWTTMHEQRDDAGIFATYANPAAIEDGSLTAAFTSDGQRTTVTVTFASFEQ